jgi:hypothetical protein
VIHRADAPPPTLRPTQSGSFRHAGAHAWVVCHCEAPRRIDVAAACHLPSSPPSGVISAALHLHSTTSTTVLAHRLSCSRTAIYCCAPGSSFSCRGFQPPDLIPVFSAASSAPPPVSAPPHCAHRSPIFHCRLLWIGVHCFVLLHLVSSSLGRHSSPSF